MTKSVRAYAAKSPNAPLEMMEFQWGELPPGQVEVQVESCGICHSDLSMLHNDWGMTQFPFVGGHEAIGKIVAVGEGVDTTRIGQRVGVGWTSQSCMTCFTCMSGDHNMCATAEGTIVGRHGGFAERVRCQAQWALPLPEALDPLTSGPLFCGGITVFNPLIQFGIQPTARVGVVGIGGLGHMALKFARAWGCEVVAFTSSDSKRDEAMQLGAQRVLNSRDDAALAPHFGTFDLIISTVNVSLNWPLYINLLAPRGRLHTVGAIAEPVALIAFPMIMGQKSFSGSPTGSPVSMAKMLSFCERHQIAPVTEAFPLSEINQAFDHLKSGQARYRIVLESDWK